MKYVWILFLLFNIRQLYATDFRTIDGKIQFPVAKVDGENVWTNPEKTQMISDKTKVAVGTVTAYSPTITNITPTKFEVALSTIISEKMSRESFESLQTKDGLFEKMRSIKADLDLANDLGDIQRANLLNQKYSWLKTYYGSLTK